MKAALAILCSVVLVTAQMLMAQPCLCVSQPAVPTPCPAACCQGHGMCCCAGKSAPAPVPASSSRAGVQLDFSLMLLTRLVLAAPAAEVRPSLAPVFLSSTTRGVQLYARDCVRLI